MLVGLVAVHGAATTGDSDNALRPKNAQLLGPYNAAVVHPSEHVVTRSDVNVEPLTSGFVNRLSSCVGDTFARLNATRSEWYCRDSVLGQMAQLLETYTPGFDRIFETDGMRAAVWCGLYFVESSSITDDWHRLMCPPTEAQVPAHFSSMLMPFKECAQLGANPYLGVPPVEEADVHKANGDSLIYVRARASNARTCGW